MAKSDGLQQPLRHGDGRIASHLCVAIVEIERPKTRVHDLRQTYADLYDDELDTVTSALDAHDDRPSE